MNQHSLSPRQAGRRRVPPARVAFIASSWHRDVVDRAKEAVAETFAAATAPPIELELFDVPGAFEMPLHAKLLARSGRYDAIIAAALVVNGGIYRHEFVASAVIDGLMRVQMETEIPVLSAVLTPRDFHEHETHRRFFSEHMVEKGREVARACMAAMASLERLRGQPRQPAAWAEMTT